MRGPVSRGLRIELRLMPMVKLRGGFQFKGTVIWLTPEQGGRQQRPIATDETWDYAVTANLPPLPDTTQASFALRGYDPTAWKSAAEGRWLLVPNEGDFEVVPGSVVLVREGRRVVAYFHVDEIVGPDPNKEVEGQQP